MGLTKSQRNKLIDHYFSLNLRTAIELGQPDIVYPVFCHGGDTEDVRNGQPVNIPITRSGLTFVKYSDIDPGDEMKCELGAYIISRPGPFRFIVHAYHIKRSLRVVRPTAGVAAASTYNTDAVRVYARPVTFIELNEILSLIGKSSGFRHGEVCPMAEYLDHVRKIHDIVFTMHDGYGVRR